MAIKLTFNEAYTLLRQRGMLRTGDEPDPRRNLDRECGYVPDPTIHDYKRMYERLGPAKRAVEVYPEECWAVRPDVYETERPRDTAFEKGYNSLAGSSEFDPVYVLLRADIASGVGRFGGVVIGVDDKKPLDTILDGVTEDGRPTARRPARRRLNFFRVVDESEVRIDTYNTDHNSRRYMMPQTYSLIDAGCDESGKPVEEERVVHWSRFHHMADNTVTSRLLGQPRMRPVFDFLCDLRKVIGSSAEMFYKGGFPGYVVKADPRILAEGGFEIDQESVDEQMRPFMDGLQRWLQLVGMEVDSLQPQVADPTNHVMMLLNLIALTMRVPLRIFMGSEQAKLAAGQDAKAWNKRLSLRQNDYLTPRVVRPLIDRLIMCGVLPAPRLVDQLTGDWVYHVHWPDVNMPDEDERSTVADRSAAAMMKFMTSGAWQMIQPSDFWRIVMGRPQAEVDVIMENLRKAPEVTFKDPAVKGAQDSGVSGKPPSDPKPAGA